MLGPLDGSMTSATRQDCSNDGGENVNHGFVLISLEATALDAEQEFRTLAGEVD